MGDEDSVIAGDLSGVSYRIGYGRYGVLQGWRMDIECFRV